MIEAPRYDGRHLGHPRGRRSTAAPALLATGPEYAVLHRLGAETVLGRDWRSTRSAPTIASTRRSIAPGELTPDGVLDGDLVLVADADLTLGGRNLPDGTLAFTNFDHTESNSLGSSILTDTDPLAGLKALAPEVAASGIKPVAGDVVVDDRLFEHFRVPNGNVLITPVIVNDNLDRRDHPADRAGPAGERRLAAEERRLHGHVRGDDGRGRRAADVTLEVSPDDPTGRRRHRHHPGRLRAVAARRADAGPDLRHPRSVRLCPHRLHRGAGRGRRDGRGRRGRAEPGRQAAGRRAPMTADTKVAEFVSLPYGQYARLILKVSHNLGANLSLMLFGLTEGARTRDTALAAERKALTGKLRHPGRRLQLPDQRQRQPRQPGERPPR